MWPAHPLDHAMLAPIATFRNVSMIPLAQAASVHRKPPRGRRRSCTCRRILHRGPAHPHGGGRGRRGWRRSLVRPAGTKRYPLALLSHGSPRKLRRPRDDVAHKYYGIALEYARRGFAALVVMRRGYGTSPGGRVDSRRRLHEGRLFAGERGRGRRSARAIDAMARRA